MTRVAFPPPRPPSQGTGGGVPGGRGSVSLLSTFNERCRALRTEPGLTPLPLGEPKPSVCHPGKTGVRRRAPQFRLCVPTSDALGLPPRPFRGQGLRWGRAGLGPAGRLCPTEAQRSRPLQPRAPGAGVGVGAALPCDPQRTVTLKTPIRRAGRCRLCPRQGARPHSFGRSRGRTLSCARPVGAAGTRRGTDHAHPVHGTMTQ